MKPTSEENSPGKIYSTLKRPQVETKVGVAYTYRYLDFLIGKDGETLKLICRHIRLHFFVFSSSFNIKIAYNFMQQS
ncbi:Raftlin [Liparis tanakae]|uniref:Raftlin n=1 Tax=Liparis tanakae TaxID=230148 RepID=A0A4Z2E904_9TELE|nr:Raftlin [Liparis tanakae]